MSRSYANLLDLSGEAPLFTRPMAVSSRSTSRSSLTRSATATGALSDGDRGGLGGGSAYSVGEEDGSTVSDAPSSLPAERLIIVANMLPLHADRNKETAVRPSILCNHRYASTLARPLTGVNAHGGPVVVCSIASC